MTAYQLQLFYLLTYDSNIAFCQLGGSGKETAEFSVSVLFRHSPRTVLFKQWLAYHGRPLVGEEI
jgi:hypothetical protein